MQEKPYYLGLDMGTNSVGWAVTDQHYNLLKAKGKDLWGIREFIEADTSVERRTHRISRRRRQREQARIGLLNDYFHDAIIAIDPSFFQRLENSKYHLEDKDQNVRYKYNIFNDPDYTDADYYTQYPTIYHLRKELLENPKPHDVRLVYLALLNMFKHRGHFLNSGISDGNNERSLKDAYINFAISVSELTEDYFNQDVDYSTIEGILSSRDLNRTKKAEELSTVLGIDFKNKKYKEYLRAICGLKINAYTLFSDQLPDDTTKIDLCVSDASFDEKSEELVSLIGEDLFQIILNIKEIYDIGSLAGILKGYTYLSQARVAAYDKHKHDLKLLKSSIKKYCTKEEYNNFFNSDADGSYASYIGSFNSGNKERRVGSKRTSEDLYKEIKKLLKGANKSDPAINEIFTSIETESFLPKQLTASNGIIPNQVHSKEMARILTNAENYLPFLKETDENNLSISNRILQLYKFQIPYYIGPVTEKSQRDGGNGWVIRKDNGRVFPWNIEEKIDVKATSEAFISRMVRRCTYMNGKQVLPKASLEYESFRVLNEINNLRIDGERIPVTLKQDIYTDLFQKGKKVTKKQLCNYLATRGLIESSEQVTGIDIAINNSLSTYGKFKAIFGEDIKLDHIQHMIEDIVFWCTVYGDSKQFLKEQIEDKYKGKLSPEQMKRILGFKFKDWGNLSKEFFELKGADKSTGEAVSIIRALWENNLNLMELINSPEFDFKEQLADYEANSLKTLSDFEPEDLNDYYFSAPVRRMIWQTTLIIKELVHVLGKEPARIFIEMTREKDASRGRTLSRKKKFEDLYKNVKDENTDWAKVIEHADESGTIRSKKMYLYLTQKGRCMYTGNHIELSDLFNDNLYDIDHIYPRHFVKDDNIDNNLVLGTISTVKKMLSKNTPLMTRLSYEGKGALANETLYSAEKAKGEGYIPFKSSDTKIQDVTKYGGFTSVTGAYFFLVEHDEKKKRIRTIESVPLYLADKIDKDSSELERYCDKLGLVNYDVRVRKIKIGSLIKYNGYFCYITGKTGYRLIVRNATNLCLASNWRKYIKKIEKYKETTIIDNVITAEENIKLYNELLNKFTVGIFGRRPNPIGEKMDSARDKFASLSIENQCLALYQILQLTAILGNESDLQLIGASTHAGKMLISKKIGTDEIYLINQSPTGLFETKIDLQTI